MSRDPAGTGRIPLFGGLMLCSAQTMNRCCTELLAFVLIQRLAYSSAALITGKERGVGNSTNLGSNPRNILIVRKVATCVSSSVNANTDLCTSWGWYLNGIKPVKGLTQGLPLDFYRHYFSSLFTRVFGQAVQGVQLSPEKCPASGYIHPTHTPNNHCHHYRSQVLGIRRAS